MKRRNFFVTIGAAVAGVCGAAIVGVCGTTPPTRRITADEANAGFVSGCDAHGGFLVPREFAKYLERELASARRKNSLR